MPKNWQEIHKDFTKELQKEWVNNGFTYEETKELVALDLEPTDAGYAWWLKNWRWEKREDTPKDLLNRNDKIMLREQYRMHLIWRPNSIYRPSDYVINIKKKDWKNIHPDFTPELQKTWEKEGFNWEEVNEWISIGFRIDDAQFIAMLKSICKDFTVATLNLEGTKGNGDLIDGIRKNYEKTLKERDLQIEIEEEEFNYENPEELMDIALEAKFSGTYNRNLKLSNEVISQIRKFLCDEYGNEFDMYQLTFEQQSLLEQLIPNLELRERYRKHGLCSECQQPNVETRSIKWCYPCNSRHFTQNFDNWNSDNSSVDWFIKRFQSKGIDLEWIPYERFANIEKIGEGGFGKVYKAEWTDGPIEDWDVENNRWNRTGVFNVALKKINNSQHNIFTSNFLREIIAHKLVDDAICITNCYGISQDPKTKEYIIVIQYIYGGDLRNPQSTWQDPFSIFSGKFRQLLSILEGLRHIHQKELVHRDLHPGNILNMDVMLFITDLGLCRPVGEEHKDKIYGVLPYIAPEVLCGKPHTQDSDIYSFGMLAYEIMTGLPPYTVYDDKEDCYKAMPYTADLAIAICNGLRPHFQIKIPQLLEDIIKKCWDANPDKRPAARALDRILVREYYQELMNKQDTKFYLQYKGIEGEYEKKRNNMKIKRNLSNTGFSCLLDFPNLPEPQNSKEVNDLFWNSTKSSQAYQDSGLINLEVPKMIEKREEEVQEKSFLQAQQLQNTNK